MIVKLLKDLEVGRKNDVIDIPYQKANYLIRVGAAVEKKQTAYGENDPEGEDMEKSAVIKTRQTNRTKQTRQTRQKTKK